MLIGRLGGMRRSALYEEHTVDVSFCSFHEL